MQEMAEACPSLQLLVTRTTWGVDAVTDLNMVSGMAPEVNGALDQQQAADAQGRGSSTAQESAVQPSGGSSTAALQQVPSAVQVGLYSLAVPPLPGDVAWVLFQELSHSSSTMARRLCTACLGKHEHMCSSIFACTATHTASDVFMAVADDTHCPASMMPCHQ
jgi:hypothetical protein